MSSFNFDLLRAQARELDQGTAYIGKKIMEPSTYGFGNKGVSSVRDVREEITAIMMNGSESLPVDEESNKHVDESCQLITEKINEIWIKLGEMETEWQAVSDYTPCPLTDNLVDLSASETNDTNDFESSDDFKPLTTPTTMMTPLNGYSGMTRLEPFSMVGGMTPFGATPRRLRFSPLCTPPVVPRMSEITMEILGRSAKVDTYRRNLLNK